MNAEPQQASNSRPPGRAGRWFFLLFAAGLLAAGWWAWQKWGGELGRGSGQAAPAPRPASVGVASARKGDLPIYVTGLGNVTPLETVVVRSRVDGELVKVAFTEGQTVKKGDLLAQIDPRPFQIQLAVAEGQKAKDAALLANAQQDLKRYEEAGEAVARQLRDTAEAAVAQYQASLKMDAAQIDAARLQLTYCEITSPLAGRIGLRLVDQGNMVHANDANGLAVITQVQPIAIQFSLPQDDLPRVIASQNAGPTPAEAFDRALGKRLAVGILSAIDAQIDPTTGTVRMKATFPNESAALFPNQFVNVRLLVDTRRDAVLVPAAAAQRNARAATFVYVVDGGKVEVRTITTGPATGDLMVVTEGLEAGEVVVTDGVDKLQAGAHVVVRSGGQASRQSDDDR